MSDEHSHTTNSCYRCGGFVLIYRGLDGDEAKCKGCGRFQPDFQDNGHHAPGGQNLPPDWDDLLGDIFPEAA